MELSQAVQELTGGMQARPDFYMSGGLVPTRLLVANPRRWSLSFYNANGTYYVWPGPQLNFMNGPYIAVTPNYQIPAFTLRDYPNLIAGEWWILTLGAGVIAPFIEVVLTK